MECDAVTWSGCLRRRVEGFGLKAKPMSARMADPPAEFVVSNRDDVRCVLCRVFQAQTHSRADPRDVQELC